MWLSVEGDLRFLSHRDLMRAAKRTFSRADLPIRYSQGFNPQPKLSLPCPRPVGVCSREDLLVVVMDGHPAPGRMLDLLNAAAPAGMRFLRADRLADSARPLPLSMRCELPVPPDRIGPLRDRLAELRRMKSWPVERPISHRRARATAYEALDLRPLVADIRLEGERLCMELVRHDGRWARPGEVLRLTGLDEKADLARTVRTKVQYEM